MSEFAPTAHLTAPVWNWGVLYTNIVAQVQEGTWKSEALWWGMDKGIVGLAPYGPMVPEDVQVRVDEAKQAIVDGELSVFAGPVTDQDGTVRIAEGETPADEDLLGMTWFVEGVVGSTE
jgi:basic membrane protein A